ncbi:MAG: DUF6273 domain-containing protein [Bacilli bacterium]|nr:DUF6273 domain-containing protein [Bacilli bacterium]
MEIKLSFIVDGEVYHTIDTTGDGIITLPDNPTKDSYVFEGWFWEDGRMFTANSLKNTPVQSSFSVYAKWKSQGEDQQPITYTITFDSKGGSAVTAITKEAGESIIAPSAPTIEGYTFENWYTDNNTFENKYEFTTMPNESFTLYAKWDWNGQSDYDGNGYYRVGEYIYFGDYPQTIKDSNVAVGTATDSRGYYLGSDSFYYTKVTASPVDWGYTFSTGDSVKKGVEYYFKVEPIKWRILDIDDDAALILCESIIFNKAFYENCDERVIAGEIIYPNNYKHSDIRTWLNNEFYNTAFNELQQELIKVCTIDNSIYSTGEDSNQYVCEDIEDKIFLPSLRDMVNINYGFDSDENEYDIARTRLTSDYTRAASARMSMHSSSYGYGEWWLRSPLNTGSSSIRFVISDGCIISYNVNQNIIGVVPALKIKIFSA